MIQKEKLEALLGNCPIGHTLIIKEVTDSTNLDIKRAAESGAVHGTVAVGEQQTAGKGRRGRTWVSPPGENLYFSMMLCPDFAAEKASMVTLVMALAVAQAVRSIGLDAGIKWPNDVVTGGKKICGILTELFFREDNSFYVVIGTGINVNQRQFPEEIQATATSLLLARREAVDREALLAGVLLYFSEYYDKLVRCGDLSGLRNEYESLLVNLGASVEVLDPKGAWKGTAQGIDNAGELLVCHEDGHVEAVYAGEVSVRGIYGYV
ncbi:MAG: biotin--[acetyl-CoA-carboxylase] ligase [Eubacteriales bacterium]|nr:biotin--[acetyl-CoA-carboxylase] ligase [Eubacteriales bacterium]